MRFNNNLLALAKCCVIVFQVHDVVETSTEEELSFMKHRSPSYLYRMSVWTAREVDMGLGPNPEHCQPRATSNISVVHSSMDYD